MTSGVRGCRRELENDGLLQNNTIRHREEHHALTAIRRESLDIYNRLHSIAEDTAFVYLVHQAYPTFPLLRKSHALLLDCELVLAYIDEGCHASSGCQRTFDAELGTRTLKLCACAIFVAGYRVTIIYCVRLALNQLTLNPPTVILAVGASICAAPISICYLWSSNVMGRCPLHTPTSVFTDHRKPE